MTIEIALSLLVAYILSGLGMLARDMSLGPIHRPAWTRNPTIPIMAFVAVTWPMRLGIIGSCFQLALLATVIYGSYELSKMIFDNALLRLLVAPLFIGVGFVFILPILNWVLIPLTLLFSVLAQFFGKTIKRFIGSELGLILLIGSAIVLYQNKIFHRSSSKPPTQKTENHGSTKKVLGNIVDTNGNKGANVLAADEVGATLTNTGPVRDALKTYEEAGLTGLKILSKKNYDELGNEPTLHELKKCAITDMVGHMLASIFATNAGLPEDEYFSVREFQMRIGPHLVNAGLSMNQANVYMNEWELEARNQMSELMDQLEN